MGGTQNNPENFKLHIYMIGESLYNLNLYLTKNIYTITKAIDKKDKQSIYDFWDFTYYFNKSFEYQTKKAFEYYNTLKEKYVSFKELLIVHIEDINSEKIDIIFNELLKLKRPHFMPVVLFLVDNFDVNNKIIPSESIYPNINPKNILTSSFISNKEYIFSSKNNELTYKGKNQIKNLEDILLRVCSYSNDLGDFFMINNEIKYNLAGKNFQYYLNICCIGRFGKGKSTCVNCILGEQKARESKSGATTTNKISLYQVYNQPIKVYDIPGFENIESKQNALEKIKELNKIDNQIHIFIYVIKSTDERMFSELEYDILVELSKHHNSKLLFVLTHSYEDIDKEEIIDMVNTGINGVIDKKSEKEVEKKNIFNILKANDDNCSFVNFYKEKNYDKRGIREFYNKISEFIKEIKKNEMSYCSLGFNTDYEFSDVCSKSYCYQNKTESINVLGFSSYNQYILYCKSFEQAIEYFSSKAEEINLS